MKKVPPTDAVLAELYGAMQTFRQLGFPSDNLFIAFGLIASMGPYTGERCVGVILRWKGQEFSYTVAPVKNPQKFSKRWEAFASSANEMPDDPALAAMRTQSFCFQNVALLIEALVKKGMHPPGDTN